MKEGPIKRITKDDFRKLTPRKVWSLVNRMKRNQPIEQRICKHSQFEQRSSK